MKPESVPLETITVLSVLSAESGDLGLIAGGKGAGLTGALLGLTRGLKGNEELDLFEFSFSGIGEVDFKLTVGRLGAVFSFVTFLLVGRGADL